MKDKTLGYKIFTICNNILMAIIIFIMAYPLYYVVIASFSDSASLMSHSGTLWLPLKPFTLDAYKLVLENPSIISGYRNTLFILVVGVILNLILTIMGAYFLSCKNIKYKNIVVIMIIITMYFSGGMIPTYFNIRDLGLLNTLWALIIPGAISTSNLIIMRTAFDSIPDSLIESASLDGASHARILSQIMVPLAVPTIAVMVLYYGVGHWNSWFSASIYLRDRELFPLQLILREILITNQMAEMSGDDIGDMAQMAQLIKYALIVVSTAPILAIYPFLQKYFVKGVMVGAIKG